MLLKDQGNYAEAEPLNRRAIEISERELGKDHPLVSTSYSNLAILLRAQGKYAQAEPLYSAGDRDIPNKLGLDHPNTVRAKKNYDRIRRTKNPEVRQSPR